jgi:transcriptional regulator with XRE-family HTH domain
MDNIFAKRLREALALRNMRPADLAEALGLTLKAVYSWTQGRYLPPLDKFDKIVQILDVSSDFLLGKVDDPKGVVLENSEAPVAAEVLFIRRAYQNMSDKERRLIMTLVKSVLEEDENQESRDGYEINEHREDHDRERTKKSHIRLVKDDRKEPL